MPEAKSDLERASMRPVEDAQEIVLEVVRGLVIELHPDMVELRLVQLDSDLDRDLALDSLTRAELLLRLNRKFKVRSPNGSSERSAVPAISSTPFSRPAPRSPLRRLVQLPILRSSLWTNRSRPKRWSRRWLDTQSGMARAKMFCFGALKGLQSL